MNLDLGNRLVDQIDGNVLRTMTSRGNKKADEQAIQCMEANLTCPH